MPLSAETARLPADADADVAYVSASFVPMPDDVRDLVERRVLPQATYVLPDGTPMVPYDHAELLREAGGDPDAVEALFRERYVAAGGDEAILDQEHEAWLSGEYGVCLRATTPESIVAKGALVEAIAALLVRPRTDDDSWSASLRGAVDALDALERPFASYDPERFGGPTSRDRFVTGVRERFPDLWT